VSTHVGDTVGIPVGSGEGFLEGLTDGADVGVVGLIVGCGEGKLVGLTVLSLQVPQDTGQSF